MFEKIFGSDRLVSQKINFIKSLSLSTEIEEQEIVKVLNNFTTFKIIQRAIAVIFTLLYVIAFLFVSSTYYSGNDYKSLITIITSFNLGLITLSFISFYFGGGALESLKR